MSDESQLRELLRQVAEPPDHVQPPVRHLIEQGRRHRARRVASWSAALSTVTAVAIVAPILALGIGPGGSGHGQSGHRLFGSSPAPVASGPTAAQLAQYRWSELPKSPFGLQQPDVVAWAGRELVEIGRRIHHGLSMTAVFDQGTGRWRQFGPVPKGVDAANAVVVWTGRELFVTDGRYPSCHEPSAPSPARPLADVCRPHAGLYNPVTNHWDDIELPKVMYGLIATSATWTGRAVVLTGVRLVGRSGIQVAAYFPSTRRWQVITPTLPAGHLPSDAIAAATTDRLLLWSLWQNPQLVHGQIKTGVDVLELGDTGGWRPVSGWPQHRSIASPTFTGIQLLYPVGSYWCGIACKQLGIPEPGFFADPVSLRRTPIPKTKLDDYEAQYLWTGRAIVEVNGQGSSSRSPVRSGETLAYDPVARRWGALRSVPTGDLLTGVVWTGSEVLALSYHGQLFVLHR
jgi:hypothetical protein